MCFLHFKTSETLKVTVYKSQTKLFVSNVSQFNGITGMTSEMDLFLFAIGDKIEVQSSLLILETEVEKTASPEGPLSSCSGDLS